MAKQKAGNSYGVLVGAGLAFLAAGEVVAAGEGLAAGDALLPAAGVSFLVSAAGLGPLLPSSPPQEARPAVSITQAIKESTLKFISLLTLLSISTLDKNCITTLRLLLQDDRAYRINPYSFGFQIPYLVDGSSL